MAHALRQWPPDVYPDETHEFPEAAADIDEALRQLQRQGPSPLGFTAKNLGKSKDYLWQLNLRVQRKQIRILYAPYKTEIVVFRIHKKGSPQEQRRAYVVAMARKKQAEQLMKPGGTHVGNLTLH
jgi:hypothetical protein